MAHIKGQNSGLWMPQTTHEKIDSQKMFIENMEQHERNYTDLIGRVHAQVNSITELKALNVQANAIKEGTMVLVSGHGLYYYTLVSEEEADDKEIIAPSTGSGLWILSGGGGNLIVDDADYGEDTDKDQDGIAIKIKKLFNKKLKKNFFPITTTKAVRDTASGKTLFELLTNIAFTGDAEEESPSVYRDADMLGGIEAKAFALKEDYNGIICVLLADNWVYDGISGTYLYTVPIPSLTGDELFDVNLYDDGTASQEQIDTFNELVSRIDVNAGEVVVQALDKPTITFSVILRGMCNIEDVVVANLSDVIDKCEELDGYVSANTDTITKLNNDLKQVIKFGDMEGNTIKEKLEFFFNNYNSGLLLIGDITIDEPIVLPKKDLRKLTLSSGTITLNCNMIQGVNYLPNFNNIIFKGNSNYIIESGYIGAQFNSCIFHKCGIIDLGVTGEAYIQSFYILNCKCYAQTVNFLRAPQCYDFKCVNSQFESTSLSAIQIYGGSSFNVVQASIDNCLFEGFTSVPPIRLGSAFNHSITNCYFEANFNGSIEYISKSNDVHGIIEGCIFSAEADKMLNSHIIALSSSPNNLKVYNNVSKRGELMHHNTSWMSVNGNRSYVGEKLYNYGYTHSQGYTNYTFENKELTINIPVGYGEFFSTGSCKYDILIVGQYSTGSAWYKGFIDATLYLYGGMVDGSVTPCAKLVINNNVNHSNGTGDAEITVDLEGFKMTSSKGLVKLKTSNFVEIRNVQLIDYQTLGSFYKIQ